MKKAKKSQSASQKVTDLEAILKDENFHRREHQRQHLRLLSHKKEFQKTVFELRKKWHISAEGLIGSTGYFKWLKDYSVPEQQIKKGIDYLLIQFDFPQNFFQSFKSYVLLGSFEYSALGVGEIKIFRHQNPKVFFEEDPKTNKKRLFIEVFADTTLTDVQKIWDSHIESEKHILQRYEKLSKTKRRVPMKNFNRNERIYLLAEEGIPYKKIGEVIKSEFGGKKLMYDEIAKIVRRFRQKIQDA